MFFELVGTLNWLKTFSAWRFGEREEESWRARHGSNHQKLNIGAELPSFKGV
jgi:hypothetical protein